MFHELVWGERFYVLLEIVKEGVSFEFYIYGRGFDLNLQWIRPSKYMNQTKRTPKGQKHEKGDCPNGGPHHCHLSHYHRGHCACEHGLVWLSPAEDH